MKHIIKIGFHDLLNFDKKLKQIEDAIEDSKNDTVKEISNNITENIKQNYTLYDNEETMPTFFERKTAEGYEVGISGEQVVYHEYGTGTKGQMNPHPNKDGKGLNPYNSGRTIRENTGIPESGIGITGATRNGIPLNEKYWTYKKQGEKKYTQGHASGKEVYTSVRQVKKDIKSIFSKKVGEKISKL